MRAVVVGAVVLLAACMSSASVAGADSGIPDNAGHPHVRAGLKPIGRGNAGGPASKLTLTVRSGNAQGVVSPNPTVYLVFWGNQWVNDPAGAAAGLQHFFAGLHGSADTYNSIFTQYCEGVPKGTAFCGTNGIHVVKPVSTPLAGVWFDNAGPAPASATAQQLAAEAIAAAAHFGNTSQAPNLNAQYVIASASGTHPDGFPNTNFCAWHDYTTSTYGNLAYTNLPYVPDLCVGACTTLSPAGPLDGYTSTETHEYSETVTDFWPSGGWNGSKGEIGDECIAYDARLALSTGTFDVQGEYSNAAGRCVTSQP
jgi:hypothetical protein